MAVRAPLSISKLSQFIRTKHAFENCRFQSFLSILSLDASIVICPAAVAADGPGLLLSLFGQCVL